MKGETLKEKRSRAGKLGGAKSKGTQNKKTIEKKIELERVKQRIFKMTDKIVNSQMHQATGTHTMLVKENGKMRKVTTAKEMDALVETGELDTDYFIVQGKEADWRAGESLLNRALGKPTESIEHSGKDGEPLIIKLDS